MNRQPSPGLAKRLTFGNAGHDPEIAGPLQHVAIGARGRGYGFGERNDLLEIHICNAWEVINDSLQWLRGTSKPETMVGTGFLSSNWLGGS